MPWMVRLPLGIRTIENIGTSAKENIMAKFFKDPDGKLVAARPLATTLRPLPAARN